MEIIILKIMQQFGVSENEAEQIISDSKKRVKRGESPVTVLFDIGLNSNYIDFLLD